MAYSVRPATVQDAPAITEIFQAAFKDNHIMKHFYMNSPQEVVRDKYVKYYTEKLQEGSLYGRRITLLVDESTGKAVAFSVWQYPHHLTPEQAAEKNRKEEQAKKEPEPPGAQVGLIEDWFRGVWAGRKKYIDPERTYFVHILAVLPEYQGKGLGGRLLRPGLEEADKAGAQTYIEASPAGLPVYLKYGWQSVDELAIDMRPYGGHGVEHVPFMMREPGVHSTTS